ncbi:hypothetical protein [uncultured Maribacter sp.]|uniref:hypothetical protein n=1 Tax=uncultured Maribacter sp. TaxID=431308 RepID=UPI002635C99D|nr:hypothetical protein [uncultured Maribacter sp.]
MNVLIKLIVGICLTHMVELDEHMVSTDDYKSIAYTEVASTNSTKDKAFKILTNKCNICHKSRNRRRVFTQENMDAWSQDVYKQVFIKKRMPKGKKTKLTNEEYQDLLTWISSTKNNQNGNQF